MTSSFLVSSLKTSQYLFNGVFSRFPNYFPAVIFAIPAGKSRALRVVKVSKNFGARGKQLNRNRHRLKTLLMRKFADEGIDLAGGESINNCICSSVSRDDKWRLFVAGAENFIFI